MFALPPMPSWEGLHPLIIHFPIGLLFIAPIFVIIGAAVRPRNARPWLLAALLLLFLGTVATGIALKSGEAGAKLAERNPQVNATIETHEGLAEQTVITFSVLTVLFLALTGVPWAMKTQPRRLLTTTLPLIFLCAYAWGVVSLANTAHQGGRLVHELGVHSIVAGSGPVQAANPPAAEEGD